MNIKNLNRHVSVGKENKMNKLNIVDMFCGGGGESTGLIEAAQEYNFDINMSAINHWERAIETHSKNYPFAEHRCENVQPSLRVLKLR